MLGRDAVELGVLHLCRRDVDGAKETILAGKAQLEASQDIAGMRLADWWLGHLAIAERDGVEAINLEELLKKSLHYMS